MYCWLAGCLDGWMSKARTTLATAHWSNGDDTILRLRYVGHTQYRSSDRAINRPTAVKGWARKEISLRPDLCLSLARLPRVAAQRSVPGSSTLTLPPSRMVIHRGGGGGGSARPHRPHHISPPPPPPPPFTLHNKRDQRLNPGTPVKLLPSGLRPDSTRLGQMPNGKFRTLFSTPPLYTSTLRI